MGKWKKKQQQRNRSRDREAGDGNRTERLQQLVREELNFLLRGELRDPRLDGAVVTMVELARDGSCARVWFSADDADGTREALEGASGFLRHDLCESLGLKRTPELRFRLDPVSRSFGDEP
jgi:ribosome-binding factor A